MRYAALRLAGIRRVRLPGRADRCWPRWQYG